MQSEYERANGSDDPGADDIGANDPKVQIAQLRAQVEQLMRDRVTPAVAEAAGRAEEAAYQARDYAEAQIEAVTQKIRERPLTALLIAAGVGYVLGRFRR